MKSPIKYYGGKSYMTEIIKKYFPKDIETYVEGFGGGASVLFSKEPNGVEIYNDLGENVYSLFKVLADEKLFNNLKCKLDLTPYSEELRQEYKEKLKETLTIEDRAYYFIYVNRTSFNGVGGFSVTRCVRRSMSKSVSDYLSMIDKLSEIHNRLSTVVIEHKDIMDLIDRYDSEDVFMYLDPPYVRSTRKSSTTYEVEMTDDEHRLFCERLLTFKGKVLISGYDNEIYDILSNSDKFKKVSFKSPNSKSDAIETLWMNYDCELSND